MTQELRTEWRLLQLAQGQQLSSPRAKPQQANLSKRLAHLTSEIELHQPANLTKELAGAGRRAAGKAAACRLLRRALAGMTTWRTQQLLVAWSRRCVDEKLVKASRAIVMCYGVCYSITYGEDTEVQCHDCS